MTPLGIDIMLWYATRDGDYDHDNNWRAPAVQDMVNQLRSAGMLDIHLGVECDFEITEGGRMYVEALKAVPLPVQVWVMP